jgi:hypothetical protein
MTFTQARSDSGVLGHSHISRTNGLAETTLADNGPQHAVVAAKDTLQGYTASGLESGIAWDIIYLGALFFNAPQSVRKPNPCTLLQTGIHGNKLKIIADFEDQVSPLPVINVLQCLLWLLCP